MLRGWCTADDGAAVATPVRGVLGADTAARCERAGTACCDTSSSTASILSIMSTLTADTLWAARESSSRDA
jgi:hypothetical protein